MRASVIIDLYSGDKVLGSGIMEAVEDDRARTTGGKLRVSARVGAGLLPSNATA